MLCSAASPPQRHHGLPWWHCASPFCWVPSNLNQCYSYDAVVSDDIRDVFHAMHTHITAQMETKENGKLNTYIVIVSDSITRRGI